MYGIILCGGSGTRLWPLSRKNFSKQFLSLYSDKSLLQETFLRISHIIPLKNIVFVTNKDNFFNVLNQIREIEKGFDKEQILVEPASRNTGPAVAIAVKYLEERMKVRDGDVIAVFPSDHYIGEKEAFLDLLRKMEKSIGENIGMIGAVPIRVETGYGYIQKGRRLKEYFQVQGFVEKPNKKKATSIVESKKYLWNCGIYLFNLRTFRRQVEEHVPKIGAILKKDFAGLLKAFNRLPEITLDSVLAKKSKNLIVFEAKIKWSDIESFDDLADVPINRPNHHLGLNSKNIFVHSINDRLVVTLGVKDLVVVENHDAIMIQKKGCGQDLKKISHLLDTLGLKELEHNMVVHRPWGKYEVLIDHPMHKVKKITVYPGAKLSLQSHKYRVEHWIVVKGTAGIVNGDRNITLQENESTFIPLGARHRLENPGSKDLEIIEIQTGSYFGEDDITRYEDIYDRTEKMVLEDK